MSASQQKKKASNTSHVSGTASQVLFLTIFCLIGNISENTQNAEIDTLGGDGARM